jgi:integrase
MSTDFEPFQYRMYLDAETNISSSTASQYCFAVGAYLKETKPSEVNDANSYNTFIIKHCMKKRSVSYYYALKNYIKWKYKGEEKKTLLEKLQIPKFFDDIKPERERRSLTETQRIEIINDMENRKHRVVAFIQNTTGVRSGDVFRLAKPLGIIDEQDEKGNLYLKLNIVGKGGKRNPVPIYDPIIAQMIFDYISSSFCVDPYYFLTKEYEKAGDGRMESLFRRNYQNYRKDLKQACKKHGYASNEFDTHDFRRGWGRDAYLRFDKDPHILQLLLRHKDPKTTFRYLRHSGLDVDDMHREMQGQK